MNDAPKISVIMPSLNVAEYIAECLESVQNQTLSDIEILCVDAGSTDGTLEFLKGQEQKDARVRVIVSDRRSYGYQVNLGFDNAKGKYIAIVETDDFIAPDMMKTLYDTAERQQADIVKADFSKFTGDRYHRTFERWKIASKSQFYNRVINPQEEPVMLMEAFYTWAGIYRRDFLKDACIRHNETAGASYQDNGFYFQTMSRAKRVYLLKKDLYRLRRDNPNSSTLSTSKVYCMCVEHDFIRSKLSEHPETEAIFVPYCERRRFDNYNWTADRVEDIYKEEFLKKYAEDFRQIRERKELRQDLFTAKEWEKLNAIIDNPEQYWEKEYGYDYVIHHPLQENASSETIARYLRIYQLRIEKEQKLRQAEEEQLRHSSVYRAGMVVTWVPRKINGFIRCIAEHGWKYTFRQTIRHLNGTAK